MTAPTKEQQKIFEGFKRLREQQQQILAETQRCESDSREARSVLASIRRWDNTDRKFYFRCVDALLEFDGPGIEKKLEENIAQLETKIKENEENLKNKATELKEYTEKHQIRFVAQ